MHLCDRHLKTRRTLTFPFFGRLLQFGKSDLYYGKSVLKEEARKIGTILVNVRYFAISRPNSVQIVQEDGRFVLRFVIQAQAADNPRFVRRFAQIGQLISRKVFSGRTLQVHLADAYLKTFKKLPILR